MPPKKRVISQNQQKLNFNNTNDSHLHPGANNKEALEHQIAKLLKLRKQLDKKKMEEQRVMRKIMNLQIHELSQISIESASIIEDEQYLIITKMESLQKLEKISLLKLMVQDYGEVVVIPKQSLLIGTQSQEQVLRKDNKQLQTMMEQWRQHGNLKEQYLVQYQQDFINILNSYQYVANEAAKDKKEQRF